MFSIEAAFLFTNVSLVGKADFIRSFIDREHMWIGILTVRQRFITEMYT